MSQFETKSPVFPIPPHSPDVGVFTCPSSECFQLALWLTHPCIEKVELSEGPCPCPCITIHRVISRRHNTVIKAKSIVTERTSGPFVMLYEADDVVLSRQVD